MGKIEGLLSELGLEVIVALARNVRLIGRVGDKLIGRTRGPCHG
jgi:hypothetical protein